MRGRCFVPIGCKVLFAASGKLTRVILILDETVQRAPEVVLFLAAFTMAPHAPLPHHRIKFSRHSALAAAARGCLEQCLSREHRFGLPCLFGSQVERFVPGNRCARLDVTPPRANLEQIRQSRPDSGLSLSHSGSFGNPSGEWDCGAIDAHSGPDPTCRPIRQNSERRTRAGGELPRSL